MSVHRLDSAAECSSRTQRKQVAAKVVGGVRGVLFLDDPNVDKCPYQSKEFGIRKNVLCHPRRPEYNHTRKGALIQREPDKMPNQAWNGDRPGLDQAQTGPKPGIVWAQTGPRPGTDRA